MRFFRIADNRHPLWDGMGAAMFGGRWNSPGQPLIYGSLSYACAMLEVLAHANIGRLPQTHEYLIAQVDEKVSVERYEEKDLPLGWDSESCLSSRDFGDEWIKKKRSAVLVIPSVIARLEFNAVINPMHPHFSEILISPSKPVVWDKRLFNRSNLMKS